MKRPAPDNVIKNIDKKRVAFDVQNSCPAASATSELRSNDATEVERAAERERDQLISANTNHSSRGIIPPLTIPSIENHKGLEEVASGKKDADFPFGRSPHASYRRVFADLTRPTSSTGYGVSTQPQTNQLTPPRASSEGKPIVEPRSIVANNDSEEDRPETEYILPHIYRQVCTISIFAWLGSLAAMRTYLLYWEPANLKSGSEVPCGFQSLEVFDDHTCWENKTFRFFSFVTATMFAASFIQSSIHLFYIHDSRRSAIWCVMTVNGVSLCTHAMMSVGAMPVFISPWGREMHVARWAEWVSLVFLLMVLMHSLDSRDMKRNFISVTAQSVSVVTGLLASILPETWWYTAGVLMFFSTIAYCDIFLVLYRVVSPENTVDPSNNNVFQVLRAQSVLLTIACTVTWSLFVIVYFVGMVNVTSFSSVAESMALNVIDVIAKFLYASVLSQCHINSLSPEETLRQSLKLKERANEAQRCFLRYVFHEVRVPLNTISLGLHTMKMDTQTVNHNETITATTENDSHDVLCCMEEACSSMSETLDDVLSYQKIEEGRLELSFNPFDARALVSHVVMSFHSVAQSRQLTLTSFVDSNLPKVLVGDAIRLKQVLNNFVSNAIKFSDDGKEIRIEVKLRQVQVDTCTVGFSVTDQGVGISDEDQTKLFQAFSQVRPGDLQQGRGSGLGLCICKNIITLHGGQIGVRSQSGDGSTFFFELSMAVGTGNEQIPRESSGRKLSERAGQDTKHTHHHMNGNGSSSSSFKTGTGGEIRRRNSKQAERGSYAPRSDDDGRGKMNTGAMLWQKNQTLMAIAAKTGPDRASPVKKMALVVDDVSSNRKLAKMTLNRFGYICDEATDGIEGFEMTLKKCYNLILMDNVMPRMTGVESARKIREVSSAGIEKPLIFGVTGNALSEDVSEFKLAGCNEVLTKPMCISHLKSLLIHYGEIDED